MRCSTQAFKTSAAMLLALAATVAVAQQANEPPAKDNTTNTPFDAWTLSCVTHSASQAESSTAKTRGCEVRTQVVIKDDKGQQGVAGVIAIGHASPEQPLQVMVQVPLAALLNQPIVLLGADDKVILNLTYVACQPQGCMAGANLAQAQRDQLTQQSASIFVGYVNQAGQKLKVEAPTKGLAKALQALDKQKS